MKKLKPYCVHLLVKNAKNQIYHFPQNIMARDAESAKQEAMSRAVRDGQCVDSCRNVELR